MKIIKLIYIKIYLLILKGEIVSMEDFNVLRVLGRGAFGKVMLVQKKNNDEIYAIKVIKKENIIDQEQIEHTKTEKIIMENFDNPFLVKLYYAFQTFDKIYFVMNFLSGGELFQHLKREKRFSENR